MDRNDGLARQITAHATLPRHSSESGNLLSQQENLDLTIMCRQSSRPTQGRKMRTPVTTPNTPKERKAPLALARLGGSQPNLTNTPRRQTATSEPIEAAIKRAQILIRHYIPSGIGIVDELINDRREEAKKE
jgi:hypothetical protein